MEKIISYFTTMLQLIFIGMIVATQTVKQFSNISAVDNFTFRLGNEHCPCISYFNYVNYTCLLHDIKTTGSVQYPKNRCLVIFKLLASNSVYFRSVSLKSSFNCSKFFDSFIVYYLKSSVVRKDGSVRTKYGERKMTNEDCSKVNGMYQIVNYHKQFLDLYNAMLELEQKGMAISLSFFYAWASVRLTKSYSGEWTVEQELSKRVGFSDTILLCHSSTHNPIDVKNMYTMGTFLLVDMFQFNIYVYGAHNPRAAPQNQNDSEDVKMIDLMNPLEKGLFAGIPGKFTNQSVKLKFLRIFENNTLGFAFQFPAKAYRVQAALSCGFCLPQNFIECQNQRFDESPLNSNEIGPVAHVDANSEFMYFFAQIAFRNISYSNGTMRAIPVLQKNILNILKYDSLKQYHNFTKQQDLWNTNWLDPFDITVGSLYLKQSVVIHDNSTKAATSLSLAEISSLVISCSITVGSTHLSNLESMDALNVHHPVPFQLDRMIQPPLSFFITIRNKFKGDKIVKVNYNFISGAWTWTLALYLETGDGNIIVSSIQATTPSPNGIHFLQKKEIPDSSSGDGYMEPKERSDKCTYTYASYLDVYRRPIACYHWLFRKWYIFKSSSTPGSKCEYHLASAGHSSGKEWHQTQGNWPYKIEQLNDIYWVDSILSARPHIPVDIKCPPLHSLLIWSEEDHQGKIHIFLLRMDPNSGDPADEPEELQNTQLCKCSQTSDVTLPIFSAFYPDVKSAYLLTLAVVCGDTICGNSVFEDEKSELLFKSPFAQDVYWFTADQGHILSLLSSDNRTIFIDEIGGKQSGIGQKFTINQTVQSESSYQLDTKYSITPYAHHGEFVYSILSPGTPDTLPVPPKECIYPGISSIEVEMISETVAEISVSKFYEPHCLVFARPAVIYHISFGETSLKETNVEKVMCEGDLENPATHKIPCRSIQSNHTRDNTLKLTINHLAPKQDYYLKVSVDIEMDSEFGNGNVPQTARLFYDPRTLWFVGTKLPAKVTNFTSEYTPKSDLTVILGTALPLIFLMFLGAAAAIWYNRQQLYMYQHLSRLEAKEIEREEKLGEGNFGEVWKAKKGNEIIVVKTLKESATDKEEKEFREEALLLSKFRCENIVKAIGICLQSRPIMLALEYMNGGSLDGYLRKPSVRSFLQPKDLLQITKDVLKGCLFLETEGYIHRDLSARNCLISVSEQTKHPKLVKLSDFGLSKDVGHQSIYKVGSPDMIMPIAWSPPEAFSGKFSSKSDVWSFGVLFWEIFSFAAVPFNQCTLSGNSHECKLGNLSHDEIEYKVCVERKSLNDFEDPCTAAFSFAQRKICGLCWNFDPDERPSFIQLQKYLSGASSEILKAKVPDFEQSTSQNDPGTRKISCVQNETILLGTDRFQAAYNEAEFPFVRMRESYKTDQKFKAADLQPAYASVSAEKEKTPQSKNSEMEETRF